MNANDIIKGGKPGKMLPPFVLCALSILLFLAGLYLPLVGMVVALASPAPMAVMTLRYGTKNGLIGLLFSSLIIYVSFGELMTISFLLGTGAFGVIIALAAKIAKTSGETMLLFVFVSIGAKIAFMFSIMSLTGHNPFLLDENSLRAIWGGGDEMFNAMFSQLPLLIPSFIALAAGLDCLVNYFLISKFIDAKEAKFVPIAPFEEWHFPRSLLFALLVALVLPFFQDKSEFDSVILSAELNLKIIVNVLFFVQGLSFVWWWTLRKKFQRGMRWLIMCILLIPIFSMGLIAIGICEIWLGLREKITKGVKK